MVSPVTFLLLTLLAIYISESEGCFCNLASIQDRYCNADFVALVKVISKTSTGPPFFGVRHAIHMEKKFRFDGKPNERYLWTTRSFGACGVNLEVNKEYIIAGQANSGTWLTIHSCGWHALWSSLTYYQKEAVEKTWKEQCGRCTVKLCSGCLGCYGRSCNQFYLRSLYNSNTCSLDIARTNWQCYEKYSVCAKKGPICSFEASLGLKRCLNPPKLFLPWSRVVTKLWKKKLSGFSNQ